MVAFPKPEFRMPKSERTPKSEARYAASLRDRLQDFRFWGSSFIRHSGWIAFMILVRVASVHAQAPTAPPQDPLLSLMLSQPKIDITSPVQASAAFDPPIVRPGESSTYRVMFTALEESIEWPSKLTV